VGDSNSWGCKQPSALGKRVQYPHWEHSPKRACFGVYIITIASEQIQ
jgi:hypothetical protein